MKIEMNEVVYIGGNINGFLAEGLNSYRYLVKNTAAEAVRAHTEKFHAPDFVYKIEKLPVVTPEPEPLNNLNPPAPRLKKDQNKWKVAFLRKVLENPVGSRCGIELLNRTPGLYGRLFGEVTDDLRELLGPLYNPSTRTEQSEIEARKAIKQLIRKYR